MNNNQKYSLIAGLILSALLLVIGPDKWAFVDESFGEMTRVSANEYCSARANPRWCMPIRDWPVTAAYIGAVWLVAGASWVFFKKESVKGPNDADE